MDQRSLYELQFEPESAPADRPNQWQRRDEFVIAYLRENVRASGRPLQALELSVGDGTLSLALLQQIPELHLTSVDIARNRLDHLRDETLRLNLEIDRLSLRELNLDIQFGELPAETFDVVVALDVLEHVFDVFGFIENCNRVLRRDGMLLLRVPNVAYLKHRVALAFGRLPVTASWFGTPGELTAWRRQHGWDGGHLHLFTIRTVRQLLHGCGFRPVHWCDPGSRLSAVRDVWPALLYGNVMVAARK